jgi:ATPase subunit of ABC transporter with duplicated ATPase domains
LGVLSADTERASLLAEAEHATDPQLQAFIDRFKAKASKAAQVQSRVKALAKLQPIAAQVDDRVVPFHFPDP